MNNQVRLKNLKQLWCKLVLLKGSHAGISDVPCCVRNLSAVSVQTHALYCLFEHIPWINLQSVILNFFFPSLMLHPYI